MTNENPSRLSQLKTHLYDELASLDVDSPQFAAGIKHILTLEAYQEIDPETKELEKERLKVNIQKERLELNNVVSEKTPWYKSEAIIGAGITAAAGLMGVIVIVTAEQFGTVILNSKAMNRLPKP